MNAAPVSTRADEPADDPEAGWRRLSPLGIVPLAARSLRQLILPTVAAVYGGSSAPGGGSWGLLIALAIIALVLAGAAFGWRRTQYRIGSQDIRLRKGIVSRQARSVPFERIQDVSLEQGPLARLLGLVEVRFETGAGGKDELKLAYVTQGQGEALRETVRARLDPLRQVEGEFEASAEPWAEPGAEAQAAPLFSMSTPRLLLFGLFEFSLIMFAVLAGAAQQVDFLLPFDIWELDEWERRLAGPNAALGAWLAGLGLASGVLGAVIGLALVALVGLATGVVRTGLRDYGFLLERTAKGFRRRRGLLTRTDVVMPVHRVQALRVTTGMLRRIWGWHGLAFISLAQDAGSGSHVVAPFAQMEELAPIAAATGLALPGQATGWQRPSPRYRMDRAALWAAIPMLLALMLLALGLLPLAALVLALGLALAGRQLFLARRERHALEPGQLLARSGWLSPVLAIAARAKLHSVEIVQGPLARRRGYADLVLGLAGGRLRVRGLPLGAARDVRQAVLDSITAVDFSQLPR